MRLSILDQAPISTGSTSVEALENTLTLAKKAEELGYHRFWIAEHHNANGLASPSPEILIARIASETATIRVGSGGVLLPQYSPLKVAETFRMLAAMFPERIDLGLGRSPGGSQQTRLALTDGCQKPLSAFTRQIKDLQGFMYNTLPHDHAAYGVKAMPFPSQNPELWVLGLSERGARHAGRRGTNFTFGHFINPDHASETLRTYFETFTPSEQNEQPAVNVCVFVVCAETKEKAEELALSQDKWLIQVEKGIDTRVPSVKEVKQHTFTAGEMGIIEDVQLSEHLNKSNKR